MHSRKIGWLVLVGLASLSVGCATSPIATPAQPPAAPAEMMIPAPPLLYFQTRLDEILSRSLRRPMPSPTD